MQIDAEPKAVVPLDLSSSAVQDQVLRQLARIVAHESFRHSKRSARMLDYLVRETIAGHAEWLKERRIGVELFSRPADYDSNADPVVRATASEIRRRLAQYYQEARGPEPIHIRLQQGSYSPVFTREPEAPALAEVPPPLNAEPLAEKPAAAEDAAETISPVQDRALPRAAKPGPLHRAVPVTWLAMFAAVLLAVAAAWFGVDYWRQAHDPVRRFWLPVINSHAPATIVVGAFNITDGVSLNAQFGDELADEVNGVKEPARTTLETKPTVMWQESEISARVAQLLTEHGNRFQLRAADAATLDDLSRGPIVLLGIIDNPWALRILPRLRFHVRMDPATQQMWIEDSEHPEQKQMSVLWGVPYSNSYSEYALITRCRDPLSGQPLILIGGLGLHGTQAAGEYVSNPEDLARLSPGLNNTDLNVQVVLRIVVVNGAVAPPQVEAIHYWK